MSEALLQGYLDFFWLVVLAVPVGLLLLFVCLSLTADINWTQKRLRYVGIFYNLSVREQLWLSVGMVRVLFVASVMFFWIVLQTSHIAFYIALFVAYNALLFRVRRFIIDVLNTAVVFVAMVVSNLLTGYYYDVSGDLMIGAVCMLLALFVTMYVAYFYCKDVSDMLEFKQVGPRVSRRAAAKKQAAAEQSAAEQLALEQIVEEQVVAGGQHG
ncbi:MAG: hypothetical protein LBL23_06075 [Coriobacteriales bacterium]|jgi:hypothetical protein|nr:hypothetical protein [Coriobacteriales bacterium]